MAKSSKILVLRRPAQVAALASPVRAGIVDALASYGASAVRELSDALGLRPESLYYHIRALQRHGLVVLHSKRKHKRRHEAVYALAAPRLTLDRTQRSRRYLDAVAKTCETLLRATARDYRAALRAAGDLAVCPPGTLSVRRLVAALDRAGLRRLNDLLRQIDDLFERHQARLRDPVQSLTIALVPLRKGRASAGPRPVLPGPETDPGTRGDPLSRTPGLGVFQ
ncbi:MAG: helix-turn-helix domain-containing protein [Planctomycetota bacterium]